MTKTVAAVKARQQFGSLLNEVDLKGANIIIERDGKPKAVMISVGQYEAMQRRRKQALKEIDSQAKRNQAMLEAEGKSFEDIESEVNKAIKEYRKEATLTQ